MPVEAIAPDNAPESHIEMSDAAGQETDFIVQEFSKSGSINIAGTDFLESLLGETPELDQDGITIFRLPEQAVTLIDSKLPPGARQNAAIVSVMYEIQDIAPQFMGYILGSGRTWWFTTFEQAMEVDPDYVAGFAKGYVEEKLWQYTAF